MNMPANIDKKITKIISTIAFFADLLVVANFIYQLFVRDTAVVFEESLADIAVIVFMFLFAFLLLLYSKSELTHLDNVVGIFSAMYVLFAALILAIKSWHFFTVQPYSFGNLFGYLLLVALIFGLGFTISVIMDIMEKWTKLFSVPFLIIGLEHIGLWLRNTLSGEFMFNIYFIGTVILFIFTGVIISFTLGSKKIIGRLKEIFEAYKLNRDKVTNKK